ncbi:MAG: CotH kinase family protein [Candidatus Hinthialibacter antarcticus]|nr:CotH kinase family protein [Candidatus Hinthialibacter antarcticus]
MNRKITYFLVLLSLFLTSANADVVINEIHYNPAEPGFEAGSLQEFIELYNPQSTLIDLSGYQFTNGITYVFPDGTIMGANEYIVLARDPADRSWRGRYSPDLGPYEGQLSNSGERIRLERPDGTIVENFEYHDGPPWPRTSDGYGSSLERIQWDLPSADFHSWRASLQTDGTPGEINTVANVLPRPMIIGHQTFPAHPTSGDAVAVQLHIDAADTIDSATLQWEVANQRSSGSNPNQPEFLVQGFDRFRYFKGTSDPSPGLEWTQPEFDDSQWRASNGGYGYGNVDFVSTQLDDMRDSYTTVYIRRAFNVQDVDELETLLLYTFYSGGFVCYINGTEVARDNIAGEVQFASTSSRVNNANNPSLITIENANEVLVEGENTIAVVGLARRLNLTSFLIAVFLLEGERREGSDEGSHRIEMNKISTSDDVAIYEAVIPPNLSQSLVRFNAALSLSDGSSLILPHITTLRPFESYFVYDGEVESKLPILWPYHASVSQLTEFERSVTGMVILPTDAVSPLVFDGALVYPSRGGTKLKFLKGEEYRNDRTLNMMPERPTGGTTAGSSSPHREHLGYWFFKRFGVPAPRAEWHRVITSGEHTQQVVFQQINERFLEMNGLNPNADLFKRNYVNPKWEPHTNKENGTDAIDALERAIRQRNDDDLRAAIEANLVEEEFLSYSVASVLTSNWDGFHNNHWMYLDPDTQKWQMIPWDLDKAWGFTDSNSMFVRMPVEFPLNGSAQHAGREPGPITGWVHRDATYDEAYRNRLQYELTHTFTEEFMGTKINEVRDYLLEDLDLLESHIGDSRNERREQINDSTQTILDFVQLRRDYLVGELGTPIQNWDIY